MEKFEILNRKLEHHGSIVDFYTLDVKVPNGNITKWDHIEHKGASAVVPVDEDGKILMVRQYRNALDRFTLEIPAGKLDEPGEPTLTCATRELEGVKFRAT